VPAALGFTEAPMSVSLLALNSASLVASWLIAVADDTRIEAAWKIFWTIVVLIVIVIITGGLIMFITRWTKQTKSAAEAYGDDRASFKVLYERGELTEEEYQKIRARLGQKLKEKIKEEIKPGNKQDEAKTDDVKAGAAKAAHADPAESDNRLSTAAPESTIRPAADVVQADAIQEGAKPKTPEETHEAVKPDDSDPSVKPA
jgi:hypothetical protein